MANTLTNLIPDAFAALDVVSRELVGFIPAVARDASADRLALGQTLRSTVAPANTTGADITPAMSLISAGDQTVGNKSITISKSRYTKFSWTGGEQRSMDAGPGFLTIQQDQIAQAMRALVNEMEVDIATAIKNGASRAFGTAGTAPFGSSVGDAAQIKKILDDNGAPASDRHLVFNTAAGVNLRSLSNLYKVNEAGDESLLRQGTLGNLFAFTLRESAQVNNATAGTGASYQINNGGGYAIGDTALTVDTGTGTILAGDVVTIGSFKYVVATALAANVVTIAAPGLRAAVADDATVTVNATSVRNAGFSRNSTLLATRLPDLPKEGDQASDRKIITDPRSGISFELAVYPGFRMNTYFIGVAWGVSVIKPEHTAILLG